MGFRNIWYKKWDSVILGISEGFHSLPISIGAYSVNHTYHGKAVANPERLPSTRTVGHLNRLTMDGDDVGGDVTNDAATDVWNDVSLAHGHHGNGSRRGQPVGLVVATRVVAHVVEVAEDKRHRVESLQTRSGPA